MRVLSGRISTSRSAFERREPEGGRSSQDGSGLVTARAWFVLGIVGAMGGICALDGHAAKGARVSDGAAAARDCDRPAGRGRGGPPPSAVRRPTCYHGGGAGYRGVRADRGDSTIPLGP